ncbi:MAG: TatD family deoxyribonuclease [Candidatus Zixiibacteriota bacterium]|nr:MAG: TatD family deoxyribonuclease [candidate division Zixibacteria bacterium]
MIDSHCHLVFDQFDGLRDQMLANAREAGVHTIINIGVDLPSSKKSSELAQANGMVYATVGIHPHDANLLNDASLAELDRLSRHAKVVGIGEIGLDFYRDLSPRKAQIAAFRRQMELAIESKLPVVIHTRESFRQSVDIVKDYAKGLKVGVFHCFPGTVEEAYEVIELGFHISVGGIITFKNAKMDDVAAEIPLDKIMIETDSPYLAPVPHRGMMNQPAYVSHVCDRLAELKGITPGEVEKVTDRTCRKLFGLVEVFGG